MEREDRETEQDVQWLGVQESLMDVDNPPSGKNTVISFGMKGMSWGVVASCRGVPEFGEVSEAEGVRQ